MQWTLRQYAYSQWTDTVQEYETGETNQSEEICKENKSVTEHNTNSIIWIKIIRGHTYVCYNYMTLFT
jgi:hypothetical protein